MTGVNTKKKRIYKSRFLAGTATGVVLGLSFAGAAGAEPIASYTSESGDPGDTSYGVAPALDPKPIRWVPDYEVSFQFGSGLNSVDAAPDATTNVGVGWEGRLGLGTRNGITVELAYIGSFQAIKAATLGSTAVLVGTAGEAALRLNLGSAELDPYALVGIGVTRFRMHNEHFNRSHLDEVTDVVHVPVGVGIVARDGGILFDLRVTMRPTLTHEQVDRIRPARIDKQFSENFDSWSLLGSVGVEF